MRPAPTTATPLPPSLAPTLLAWYRLRRRALPWRLDRNPYRVWVAEPLLRDLSAQLAGRVKIARVNVDEAALVTRSYGIHMIPTYVFVQGGQEKGREVGSVDLVAFREGVRKYFSNARLSGGRRASR